VALEFSLSSQNNRPPPLDVKCFFHNNQRTRSFPATVPVRGFSIVELLVVIGVVTIVLGLAVPALSESRQSVIRARCLTNCRQNAAFVTSYAADHADRFPSWEPEPRSLEYGYYHSQSNQLMMGSRWSNYCGIPFRDGILYCPGNANGRRSKSSGPANDGWERLDYAVTSSVWIDPNYLDPGRTPASLVSSLGGKVQRLSSVAFPSSKVDVFEDQVFHAWSGVVRAGTELGFLHYLNNPKGGSVSFFDGHARNGFARESQALDRKPFWFPRPYCTTPWGIWGRDFTAP